MSNDNHDGERIDRRSYLAGSAVTLGALSIGTGSVAAGDERKKGKKTGEENGENGTSGDRTVITECTTITDSGSYVLGDDLRAETDDACIVVRADDVLLDGGGRTISGPEEFGVEGVGVLVQPPAGDSIANVTITNLVLEDLFGGIVFDNVTDGVVTNVTSQMATISGTSFTLLDSHRNQFVENSIERGGTGMWLVDSNENVFVRNTTTNTFFPGIDLGNSDENWFTENTVVSADGIGILLQESDRNWLVGNTANQNASGIRLQNSDENRLDLNTANENVAVGGGSGFGIAGDRNRGRGNTAEGNPLGPISVSGTDNAIEVNGTVHTGTEEATVETEVQAGAEAEGDTDAEAEETATEERARLVQFVESARP